MKRNSKIIEIDAGGRLYCYRTATKGWKGNKKLISWFRRFTTELIRAGKK